MCYYCVDCIGCSSSDWESDCNRELTTHFLGLDFMTGKVDERESCESGEPQTCLRASGHRLLRHREFNIRSINCFRTLGVKTQKRRALTKPWPESPIPCIFMNHTKTSNYVYVGAWCVHSADLAIRHVASYYSYRA